jgi:hypothetical protein
MYINKLLFIIIILFIFPLYSFDNSLNNKLIPPANKYNLSNWKLQIPGPLDIINLENYASKYFYLKNDKMVFWLDSSEKGTTKNTIFIRSELRHLLNWNTDENHKMKASLKINSDLSPNKATVLKIHGFTNIGEYAPTLIRIAYNYGDLFAFINKSGIQKDIEKILLIKDIGNNFFQCEIIVYNKSLIININGIEKINKDISYWKYKNYFKAGCYPQSHNGEIEVIFDSLYVE